MSSQTVSPSPPKKDTVRAGLVVVAITFLAYLPAVFHSFVEWDDVTVIAGNPLFNPVSWHTVGHYWTHIGENLYIPVTYTFWAALGWMGELNAADALGSRLNPYVFHLASVLLHATAALAVYLLLHRAVRSAWPAAVGALFFALHPIQVEAVAFIGAMNTPLAAAIGFSAVWLYLRSGDSPAASLSVVSRWTTTPYLIATALMLAALLSKPTAVVLPVVGLLLDLTAAHRVFGRRTAVIAVLPWLGLSAACAACTRLFQTASLVQPSSPWTHLLVAADAALFYLRKLIAPWPLAIDYGRHPQFSVHHYGLLVALISAAILIAVLAIDRIAIRTRAACACSARAFCSCDACVALGPRPRKEPTQAMQLHSAAGRTNPESQHGLILAVSLAIVGLLPNSGLVSFDFQLFSNVADRYVYLAMLGPSLLVALALAWMMQLPPRPRLAGIAIFLSMLIALTTQTLRQIPTWTDGTTLFHHAIAVNPNSWMSYANLAYIEAESNPPQALADCQRSLAINPANAIAWNTLGSLLISRNDRASAIQAFDTAHHLQPDSPLFATNAATARVNPTVRDNNIRN